MGAINDLYVVAQKFLIYGVEALIRRYYQQLTAGGDAETLSDAWNDMVVGDLLDIMSDDASVTGIRVVNLDNMTDFYNWDYTPSAGTRTGSAFSSFASWGFILNSSDRRIRSGGFRVPGVNETDVTDGEADSGMTTVLNALASSMDTGITDPAFTGSWWPVLYTPGNDATSQVPLIVDVASCSYARVTTQNTRKTWRP